MNKLDARLCSKVLKPTLLIRNRVLCGRTRRAGADSVALPATALGSDEGDNSQ